MPKILYIASTVGHLKSFHLPYIRQLSRDGWTVHTAGKGGDEPLPGGEAGFDIAFEKSMFSPKNIGVVLQLRKLLRAENYDAVSVHTSLAAFFTRLAVMLSGRRPLVVNTVHGYLFDQDTPQPKQTILRWAEKLTAGSTDLLLTMNARDTKIATEHRLCRGEILYTKGLGVDFSRFAPADVETRMRARKSFGIPDDAFVLVYAAEFSGRKNQQALLRAAARLPTRVWLLLAGRGDLLEECKDLTRELGIADQVVFAGFVKDVERCYHAADVCLSTSRSEGLPFNLMEAMSCALPVVATAVKGHEDLVEPEQTGLLVPFGDEDGLCAAITRLLEHPELCLEWGYRAREQVAQYELQPVLEANMEMMNCFFRKHGVALPEKKNAQDLTQYSTT